MGRLLAGVYAKRMQCMDTEYWLVMDNMPLASFLGGWR